MEISLTIAIFLTVSEIASAYTPAEIAAESKKANDFFEHCWDETLSRHPVDESFYRIKTHYDELEDLSDDKATADEKDEARCHHAFFFARLQIDEQLIEQLGKSAQPRDVGVRVFMSSIL